MSGRRGHNHGLRKVCGCRRSSWPKCPHAWHFSYKPRGGKRERFSLDVEINKHIESKIDAEKEVTRIKAEIDAGTFRRAAERRAGAAPETGVATVVAGGIPSTVGGVTFDAFVKIYVDRVSKASGKESWKDDESRLEHVCAYHRRRWWSTG